MDFDEEPTEAAHYAVLGLRPGASAAEVSAAYGRRVADLRARQQAADDATELSAAQHELADVEAAWRVLGSATHEPSSDFDADPYTTDAPAADPSSGSGAPQAAAAKRGVVAVAVGVLALGGVVAAGMFASETTPSDTSQVTGTPRDVTNLRPGDCFDSSFDGANGEVIEVEQVTAIPCEELHTNQVFAIHRLSGAPDAPFPGADEAFDASGELCLTTFAQFVGMAYEESALDISLVYPSATTWDDGDREVICAVFDPAGPVSTTLEGANR